MVSYHALFDPDRETGGFVVTFPDFAYGVTQGETLAEAAEMAADLLAGLIFDLIAKGDPLPEPHKRRGRHFHPVSLPLLEAAKVDLYRAFQASGLRKSELARRLGIPKTNVDRLFDLKHHSRLDLIEAAFRALGKEITIEIRDAA